MIKVLAYDDNRGVLEALKLFIDESSDIQCVGTFENCANVYNEVNELKPQVVLMDIDMPRVNGIEGLKIIRKNFPGVMVVMQTVFEEEDRIFEAIRAGAHGYFLKKTSPDRLIDGIRNVMEGGAPMTDSVAKKVLETFQNQDKSKLEKKLVFDLTERELEILRLLAKGLSYKMIADTCSITFFTVNFHCKKIYEKFHVHSATEAVVKAIENKVI